MDKEYLKELNIADQLSRGVQKFVGPFIYSTIY